MTPGTLCPTFFYLVCGIFNIPQSFMNKAREMGPIATVYNITG